MNIVLFKKELYSCQCKLIWGHFARSDTVKTMREPWLLQAKFVLNVERNQQQTKQGGSFYSFFRKVFLVHLSSKCIFSIPFHTIAFVDTALFFFNWPEHRKTGIFKTSVYYLIRIYIRTYFLETACSYLQLAVLQYAKTIFVAAKFFYGIYKIWLFFRGNEIVNITYLLDVVWTRFCSLPNCSRFPNHCRKVPWLCGVQSHQIYGIMACIVVGSSSLLRLIPCPK